MSLQIIVNKKPYKMLIYYIMLLSYVCGQDTAINKPILRKCCPKGSGLSRQINGSFSMYDCMETEAIDNANEKNILELQIGHEYNVQIGLPAECVSDDLDEVLWEDTEPLPHSYCLDKVLVNLDDSDGLDVIEENNLVVLSCNPKNVSSSFEFGLKNVRKCCPEGSIYNITAHTCVKVEGNSQLEYNFGQSVYSLFRSISRQTSQMNMTYGINCPNYAINYVYDLFVLEMRGRDINLIERSTDRHVYLKHDQFCVDENEQGSVIVRGCRPTCDIGVCIQKCCPDGQVYIPKVCGRERSDCHPYSEVEFSPQLYDVLDGVAYLTKQPEMVGLHYGIVCPLGRYSLGPNSHVDGNYLDASSGRLFLPNFTTREQWHDVYCKEVVDKTKCGGGLEMQTHLCFPDVLAPPYKFTVGWICVGISCIFLLATLVVYLSLAELRNLHGKTLMCHVVSMLIAYAGLCRVQYGMVNSRLLCTLLGYTIYFSFMAAFFWLNIMCFDIWWTFGSVKTVHMLHRPEAETRRFIFYSLYAWGMTLLVTCTMLLLDFYPVSPYLDANMGKTFCWFGAIQNNSNDSAHYILFVFPVGLLIGINLVLFVMTAVHCSKVKNEIHRLQAGSLGDRCKKRFLADRAKYTLNFKLFVVMGISWVWEIVSTLFDNPYQLILIGDIINLMIGIPIFCILVLKPKVYRLIKKKMGLEKVTLKETRASTNRTISTQISRTTSSDDSKSLRPPSAATLLRSDKRGGDVTS